MTQYHHPVLVREVEYWLRPVSGGIYIDATLGGGGHSEMLLEKSAPDGLLFGVDRDLQAIEYASARLARFGERFTAVKSNFVDVPKILAEYSGRVSGYLMDLGVSSHQLDSPRGFSFMRNEPLDMRMDTTEQTLTAFDIVNNFAKERIAGIVRKYGEEKHFNRVASAIVRARERKKITTTAELASVIRSDIGRFYTREQIDPCTRTFMALRIYVNDELETIEKSISGAVDMLKPGGRLAVISFHSLEDRIVKNEFKMLSGRCQCPPRAPACQCGAVKKVKIMTAKPIVPKEEEIVNNPRARSSKMRCVERV